MAERTPSDIARDTLKQLSARRLAPTPDNFRRVYDEIAGAFSPAPFPERQFRQILRVMPAQTTPQRRLLDQLEKAVSAQDWQAMQAVLVGYAKLGMSAAASSASDSMETLAIPNPIAPEVAECTVRLVDTALACISSQDERLASLAGEATESLRSPMPTESALKMALGNFSFRLSFAAEEQTGVQGMLLTLLGLVFENMAALSTDDQWLHGQTQALVEATALPMTLRKLDDVQLRLKDVIFKQTEAKGQMVEAQDQMKALISVFITRLQSVTQSSSASHAVMEECAQQVARATNLQEISPILEKVMATTRALAMETRVAHDELAQLRQHTHEKQEELTRLQRRLDQVSQQARHDPLTGSLNRKGLDEVMTREIARARRGDSPLCVALLDVDNFKQINDRLGHATGDAALLHLADVARAAMRSQDMLARYGGEEFVLVLPDSTLAEGVEAMQRLQRELTKNFFLQGSEKLLITFSAGIAQLTPTDSSHDAITRADRAMYLAKRQGKNRVVAA